MTLQEAISLITTPVLNADAPQQWADLGCGAGLFSKALLRLLPDNSTIHAVDSRTQELAEPGILFIQADFEKDPLPFPLLNGIIMANSLHYVKNKLLLLGKLKSYLKEGGLVILVEYEKRWPNPWVPYPLRFSSAEKLFIEAGFSAPEQIAERPSVYSSATMYSAWCRLVPPAPSNQ